MAPERVDVHHHIVPPFYVEALEEGGGDPAGWTLPDWTVEKDLEFTSNDKDNIAFSFLTVSAPGAGILPPEKQAAFSRKANEYAASICSAHPIRYGFFATVPSLLDPASAHQELVYALDKLGADGVILLTRYGKDNHYLGHPDFRTTWDLLEARKAVVFIHPTHAADATLVNPSLPSPMIDYPHETTRTAVDLITSGVVRSHPGVRIILPHAGGTLPYLALRPAAMLAYMHAPGSAAVGGEDDDEARAAATDAFLEDARSFYFDTALSAGSLTLGLLEQFARPGHVLFGTDYPYAPMPTIRRMNDLLEFYGEERGDFVTSVHVGAALELFPRLKGVVGYGGSD